MLWNCRTEFYLLSYLQNYETVSSSNPKKVKRDWGGNMCKEVAALEIGWKLKWSLTKMELLEKIANCLQGT